MSEVSKGESKPRRALRNTEERQSLNAEVAEGRRGRTVAPHVIGQKRAANVGADG